MADEEEYQRLRQIVTNLLVRIEDNQQIQARFNDFEFQLLDCDRLAEILDKVLVDSIKHFDLTAVSLVLYDPDYSITSLVEHLDLQNYDKRFQLRYSQEFFTTLYQSSPTVRLGELDVLAATRLFPKTDKIGSAVLMPLMRQQRQIGSLHFGSHSATRYSADKATSFMWHLASVVAVCLENCVALEQLQRQGMEDILTQVHNRRSFELEFGKELERADRQKTPLSCLFVDIDHFKQINDSYGHPAGDRCLRQVAHLISEELRKTDLLARYGGEEFVALLPHCQNQEAHVIAERVRLAIANNPLKLDEQETIPLTVSVGLTTWQPDGDSHNQLNQCGEKILAAADRAMYAAKRSGRNQVQSDEIAAV
jgi:diguanylate cyclase (GGDEF)-like protein